MVSHRPYDNLSTPGWRRGIAGVASRVTLGLWGVIYTGEPTFNRGRGGGTCVLNYLALRPLTMLPQEDGPNSLVNGGGDKGKREGGEMHRAEYQKRCSTQLNNAS